MIRSDTEIRRGTEGPDGSWTASYVSWLSW